MNTANIIHLQTNCLDGLLLHLKAIVKLENRMRLIVASWMSWIQKATDDSLRMFFTSLPIGWQHFMRDRGFIKFLSDFAAISMIPTIALTAPRVAYRTIRSWLSSKYLRISCDHHHSPALEYHKLKDNRKESVDEEKANQHTKLRLLLFVHGGAWGSGQLWQYRDVAIQYGKLLRMDGVALFKYSYYPDAIIMEQRDALLQAINHIHSPDFQQMLELDTSNGTSHVELIICGHSSGAHLAVLSVVELLRLEASQLFENSRVANRPLIHAVVGLSGPYDLVKHYDFESGRGVQHISPMLGAAGDSISGLALCSPDILLETTRSFQSLPATISDHSVRNTQVHLLHGEDDGTVPHEATERMVSALQKCGFRRVNGYYYPGHHLQPIFDVILCNVDSGNRTKDIISTIEQDL